MKFTNTRLYRINVAIWGAICLWALAGTPAHAQSSDYPRAGWTTTLTTNAHGVSGTAEIIDARTIRLTNFNYDGGGPQVYAYLGATNDDDAFADGLAIGELLTRPGTPYVDATVDLVLPAELTLDGYDAISIWCVDFRVNFGSGTFAPADNGDGPRVYLPLMRAAAQ